MSGRLEGKIAVVTGGAKGIGRGIAERFAAEGAQVVIADIDAAAGQEVAGAIGAEFRRLDVADPQAVEAFYAELGQRHGRLDVQVSNAGITDRMPFLETTLAFFDRVHAINLRGLFLCGQLAARLMIAAEVAGRIVNMASISGQHGGLGRAAYGSSKAGIVNLTQVMAAELAPYGILVNAIAPGPIKVGRGQDVPGPGMTNRLMLKRYGLPEEVAAAALFLASDESGFVTGSVINVDGGFNGAGVMGDT